MNWLSKITHSYRSNPELADVFGVVLYTDEHPYIKKVLRDHDFWVALDEQSGPEWAIFSVKPQKGTYDFPNYNSKPGVLYQMVAVWKEPRANKELIDYLGIDSTSDLPLLVLYTHTENGEILRIKWRIEETSQEDAYQSLSQGIKIIRKAIDGVLDENKKYGEGVFRAIEMAISSEVEIQRIKKGINFYAYIKSILP